MTINKLLNVAARSLFVHQSALNVTSNNISNTNNPDFSRRRVTFYEVAPEHRYRLGIGSGVDISKIIRVRNDLTDKQILAYNQPKHFHEKYSESLGNIEHIYSEPTDLGFSNLMNQFFNSWDELAANPASFPLRNNVINSAQKMSTKLGNIYDGYNVIKKNTKLEAEAMVEEINGYVNELHRLNKEIYRGSIVDRNVNDLLDKRDATLDNLSKLVNITVSYDDKNIANVSIGGTFAVDRVHKNNFILKEEEGRLKVKVNEDSGNILLTDGELAALNKIYSEDIPNQLKELDKIGVTIFDEVNKLHSQGYTTHEPPQTGVNFFDKIVNGKLIVNEDILADARYIAVSSNQNDGNGDVALKIADIRNGKLIDGFNLEESFSNIVNEMANKKIKQEQEGKSLGLVLNQLDLTKKQLSGVSTDEEMVNIIKFQRSYNASAKLVRVADELYQTLLSMV